MQLDRLEMAGADHFIKLGPPDPQAHRRLIGRIEYRLSDHAFFVVKACVHHSSMHVDRG